MLGAEIIVVV